MNGFIFFPSLFVLPDQAIYRDNFGRRWRRRYPDFLVWSVTLSSQVQMTSNLICMFMAMTRRAVHKNGDFGLLGFCCIYNHLFSVCCQDLGVHKVGHLKRIQHGIRELSNRMSAVEKYCTNYQTQSPTFHPIIVQTEPWN